MIEENNLHNHDKILLPDDDALLTTCVVVLYHTVEHFDQLEAGAYNIDFIKDFLYPFCNKLKMSLKRYKRNGAIEKRDSVNEGIKHLIQAEIALSILITTNRDGEYRGITGEKQIKTEIREFYKCIEEIEKAYLQLEEFLP